MNSTASLKNIPWDERLKLLKTIRVMESSTDILEQTGIVISNTVKASGSEAAEAKAKEMRELIESGMEEKEILKRLKAM